MYNNNSNKWLPFNAVANGSSMINHVLSKKCKTSMPILSEDQNCELQEKILNAYNNKSTISIRYFYKGNIYIIEGIIENIDTFSHKLMLNNEKTIFFSQIIEIL